MMRSPSLIRLRALVLVLLGSLLPSLAEAAKPTLELSPGDRVLVTGSLQRKCSAKIDSIASPGNARLVFDRPQCGDASIPYKLRNLQRISFQAKAHDLAEGDAVIVRGHFGNECMGRVHEVSRAGYTAVDLDSLLCAERDGLYKSQDVHKVQLVPEADANDHTFTLGERVSAAGIHEGDACVGVIKQLTSNGLATLAFEELTCAYGGKLYPLTELQIVRTPKERRHASGQAIFQRVMREIASAKKAKKNASF